MNSPRSWRLATKMLHEVASIGFGGAPAACLVINHVADRSPLAQFAAARHAFEAIAKYVLPPSMAVVVISGLLAVMFTRAHMDAGWAWLKGAPWTERVRSHADGWDPAGLPRDRGCLLAGRLGRSHLSPGRVPAALPGAPG